MTGHPDKFSNRLSISVTATMYAGVAVSAEEVSKRVCFCFGVMCAQLLVLATADWFVYLLFASSS